MIKKQELSWDAQNASGFVVYTALEVFRQNIFSVLHSGGINLWIIGEILAGILCAVGIFLGYNEYRNWFPKLIPKNKNLRIIVKRLPLIGIGILFIFGLLNPAVGENTTSVNPNSINVNNSPNTVITQNQTGGIAANTVIIGNLHQPPRHVDTTFEAELNQNLRNEMNKTIVICAIGGSPETNNYASEIYQFLSSERYKTETCSIGMMAPPVYGVRFSGINNPYGGEYYEIDVGPQS